MPIYIHISFTSYFFILFELFYKFCYCLILVAPFHSEFSFPRCENWKTRSCPSWKPGNFRIFALDKCDEPRHKFLVSKKILFLVSSVLDEWIMRRNFWTRKKFEINNIDALKIELNLNVWIVLTTKRYYSFHLFSPLKWVARKLIFLISPLESN